MVYKLTTEPSDSHGYEFGIDLNPLDAIQSVGQAIGGAVSAVTPDFIKDAVSTLTGPVKDFANTTVGQITLTAFASSLYGALAAAPGVSPVVAGTMPFAGTMTAQAASLVFAVPGLAKGDDFSKAYMQGLGDRIARAAQSSAVQHQMGASLSTIPGAENLMGVFPAGAMQAGSAILGDIQKGALAVLGNTVGPLASLTARQLMNLLHIRGDAAEFVLWALRGQIPDPLVLAQYDPATGMPIYTYTGVKAISALADPLSGYPNLESGSTGPFVLLWQVLLGATLTPGATPGQFGGYTVDSTKRWQAAHGLPQTGVVDRAAWAKFDAAVIPSASAPPAFVAQWQQAIGVPATGVYDAVTQSATKALQAAAGETPNGIVGLRDWMAVAPRTDFGFASTLPNIGQGSTGPLVLAWQTIIGPMPTGTTPGQFGLFTVGPTKAWQTAHQLPATGVVDVQTWGMIPILSTATSQVHGSRAKQLIENWQLALGIPVTGVFDSATDNATRAWQTANGFPSSGVVSVRHWIRIAPTTDFGFSSTLPVLQQGATGPFVKGWQVILGGYLPPGANPGEYGPYAVAGTQAFQRANSLPITGVVDAQTWGYVPILSLGSIGPMVSNWQAVLNAIGRKVTVTGTFDAATQQATMAWQAANKLPADGVVSVKHWLIVAPAIKLAAAPPTGSSVTSKNPALVQTQSPPGTTHPIYIVGGAGAGLGLVMAAGFGGPALAVGAGLGAIAGLLLSPKS